jgi:hypothetical protein
MFSGLLLFNAAYGAWGNGESIAALAAMIAGWAAMLWVGGGWGALPSPHRAAAMVSRS